MKKLFVSAIMSMTALVMGFGSSALANTLRISHASACYAATTDGKGHAFAAPLFNQFGQIGNSSTSQEVQLWCPITYDTTSTPTSATADFWSNGCNGGIFPGVLVSACVLPQGGGSAVCASSPFNNCNFGNFSTSATFPSHNVGDFLFLEITLAPQNGTGGQSGFFGYALQ